MSKTKRGLLVIIAGPSGVGKGTVRAELSKDESLKLFYSVSCTTRKMRPGEVDGRDYYFITDEAFDRRIAEGSLLEWAEFVGHRYGTPRDIVEKMRDEGLNVLLEIEVKGTKQVLEKCQGDPGLVSIFLMPPSLAELERRIRGRSTEPPAVVRKRLSRAKEEMKMSSFFQYVIVNDHFTLAAKRISAILRDRMRGDETA